MILGWRTIILKKLYQFVRTGGGVLVQNLEFWRYFLAFTTFCVTLLMHNVMAFGIHLLAAGAKMKTFINHWLVKEY